VTRGQLPQSAGSLGLNGGGTAAAVPPVSQNTDQMQTEFKLHKHSTTPYHTQINQEQNMVHHSIETS